MSINQIKNLPIFPVFVHEAYDVLGDEELENLRKACEELDYYAGDPNIVESSEDSRVHLREEFEELTIYAEAMLNNIRIAEDYDTPEFKISQMWVNKGVKGTYHHQHWHSNSFFSGIFYITENVSPTVFYDPVFSRQMSSLNVWASTTQPAIPFPDIKNCLRIFPAYMQHKTLPNQTDEVRYTISFNAIPIGLTNANNPYTRLSVLDITMND